MSILFLTDLEMDSHALPVAAELGRRGHEVRVFNPGDFPLRARISVHGDATGQRAVLAGPADTIDLSSVQSVWYRRPGKFEFEPSLPAFEADWLRSESSELTTAIWSNSAAFWVSDPRSLRYADLKLVQLEAARRLGLASPDYLVTNDPDEARAFVLAQPQGAIAKALGDPTVWTPGHSAMIYTHRVTPSDLEQLEAVQYGPTFLQSYVVKRRDIRITIIGDALFAVAIDPAGKGAAEVDFRRAEIMDLPHQPLDLPADLHDACLILTRQLGLQFGAIDVIETLDGDYLFLEINPNGQWLWIEMMTDLPLTSAMADLLESAGGHPVQPTRQPAARKPRRSGTLPVGTSSVPLPAAVKDTLDWSREDIAFAGTGVWIGSRDERVELHVGDVEVDQS